MLINFDRYSRRRIMRPKSDEISSQPWRRGIIETGAMNVKTKPSATG